MASIGDIILSREKTEILPGDAQSPDGDHNPYFTLRSNRTMFTLADPP